MPPELPVTTSASPHIDKPALPGLLELFVAFAGMSLAGFGGVLVFARRAIVDKYRWMTADEFNETFALCHFLPGPNIVNLSVVFGARIRGVAGSIAAFTGLLGPPFLIVTALAMIYARYGDLPVLRRVLDGVSCAAVGLLLAVTWRMMLPLLKRRDPSAIGLLLAVFVTIGVLRWPLPQVLLVAVPASLGITFLVRRRAKS
ncbi:MAG: chromate transporter [Rhizobiales bacterium 62-47]|nr:chromate transporter [Hyphomicrobiales bacterium]OJY11994.1 MAG: chromate transporter [Rhizobiales bacterium 62-47]